ncbi:MAG: EfeM/EfeO family lipoprotein [Myxococcota bacterium]
MRTQALFFALVFAGCGADPEAPKDHAIRTVKSYIAANLEGLVSAAAELETLAPAPDADGWNAAQDAAPLEAMRGAWKRARSSYEHIEGAIAVLFPELDVSTDERYDGFVSAAVDEDLFDDQGVTGVHAIERILWSNAIPAAVLRFEEGLPGGAYRPARFPENASEAQEFKEKLCHRLRVDVSTMREQFAPLALDASAAYRGVIGSMAEQVEKLEKAASGEEESRYAQYTLADMRANLEAARLTYEAFRPWLLDRDGTAADAKISAGFDRLELAYGKISGDALPPVPATWSAAHPSKTDLATPFGQLYAAVLAEVSTSTPAALVFEMDQSASLMGIPTLAE